MCNYIYKELSCQHHYHLVESWCPKYIETERRCPPTIVSKQYWPGSMLSTDGQLLMHEPVRTNYFSSCLSRTPTTQQSPMGETDPTPRVTLVLLSSTSCAMKTSDPSRRSSPRYVANRSATPTSNKATLFTYLSISAYTYKTRPLK
ncbi:hypothetical protein FMEXI_1578 [Fusarium mexicanum]|uniref:Uncharacterized protein n=1 Tax=Fusarium mexicanum TaxID=751941 RepID=A0A8H5JIG5_9HYPO|nr:hypothetical protein FMEXI_1578 [Fusarium mexicanum]